MTTSMENANRRAEEANRKAEEMKERAENAEKAEKQLLAKSVKASRRLHHS